jgi:hypothetical protein
VFLIEIPVLCDCPECNRERGEGPDLDRVHELINALLALNIEELDDFIEEMEEVSDHLNIFTGKNNERH